MTAGTRWRVCAADQPSFKKGLRRLSSFGLSALISGVAAVVVVPLIIILAGPDGWSAVAIGQACGTVAAVFSGYGWAITGPSAVAKIRQRDRAEYFAESFFVRAMIFVVIVAVPTNVAAAIAPQHQDAAALVAASLTVYGLGGTWFFVGSGNPAAMLICDTAPKVLSNIVGIVLLRVLDSIVAYAIAQLAFALVSVILTLGFICGDRAVALLKQQRLSDIPTRLLEHIHGPAVAILSAAYLSLPVVLVAVLNPPALVGYSVAEKLLRAANAAQQPFTQTIQGWIPATGSDLELSRRMRRGLGLSAALALLGGGALTLLGPLLGEILGAGRVAVGYDIAPAVGIALAMTVLSQCAGIACLMAIGRGVVVTVSAFAGCVTALVLVLAWTVPFGAPGAMYGVALGELLVTLIQLGALARILRRTSDQKVQTPAPPKARNPRSEATSMASVTVLTVTYGDRWATLQETLASVLREPSSRVIVVANGSRPTSAAQLDVFATQHAGRVRVVWLEKNLGSSPAFSGGLEAAYDYGDAILILDDDNPISDGLISKLREIEARTRAKLPQGDLFALEVFRGVNSVHRSIAEGASVDHLFREQRPGAFQGFDLPSLVNARLRGRDVTHASNAARTLEVETDGETQTLVAIPNAMWGGLFLPEDVVRRKVLPETELILYGDDNDFSGRLREQGITIYLCLGVEIEDTLVWKVQQRLPGLRGKLPTTFQIPDSDVWRLQYLHRNQAYLSLLRVGHDPAARLRFAVNVAAKLVLLAAIGLVAGRPGHARKLISASVSGLRRKLGPSYPLPG